jgi:hypothetical protein
MHEFGVFQQERVDGGVRAGVSLDDETCWHLFEPGGSEDDPALRWYIDIRGSGDSIPTDPLDLHQWLSSPEFVASIRDAAAALAERVAAGIDQGGWPVRQEVANAPEGAKLALVASAVSRSDSLEIARLIRRFGQDYPGLLERMQTLSAVA